ncbi:hypothetical protein, partial [Mangrovicoccus sp. HB161399]|uniref:hypothetical protein n=1 Tax=Mangrovicoccus sp. HB161399 TaxID=2720392 RepID=UPI001C131E21
MLAREAKGLAPIGYPRLAAEDPAAAGHMGHDRFALEGRSLVRRFPLCRPGDANAAPGRGAREIVCGLEQEGGERMRRVTATAELLQLPRQRSGIVCLRRCLRNGIRLGGSSAETGMRGTDGSLSGSAGLETRPGPAPAAPDPAGRPASHGAATGPRPRADDLAGPGG